MIDFRTIAANASLPDLAMKAGIALKPNGREFHGCCPFHSEKTPSFQIYPSNKGGWNFVCQGCGAKGNAIDFMAEAYGLQPKEAAKLISGETNFDGPRDNIKSPAYVGTDPYADLRIGRPPPEAAIYAGRRTPELFNPKRGKFVTYTPSDVYEITDKHGDLIGYSLRIEFDDKKITPTIFWVKNVKTEWEGFSHFPHPEPRPLVGLGRLYEFPDRQVIITEGEKCRKVAEDLFGDKMVSVCWLGGANAVSKSYWRSLSGRSVITFRDNDTPGEMAMFAVHEALKMVGAKSIKAVDLLDDDIPEGVEKKGADIADLAFMGRDWVADLMRRRIRIVTSHK